MSTKTDCLASLMAISLLLPLQINAQDETTEGEVEEVIVTGSRIKRDDVSSSSPMTVLTGEAIGKYGTNNIEDLLAESPVFQNVDISTDSNGFDDLNSGVQRTNIRGIGEERSLNLLNGRRWITTGYSSASLTDIPTSMIERIEVLRDGASAIYGSDAVAGVVNVITKRNFEGLAVSARYGTTQEGGGDDTMFSLTTGISGDNSNLTLGVQIRKGEGVSRSERPLHLCPGGDIVENADGSRTCPTTNVSDGVHPAGLVTIATTGNGYTAGEQYIVENGVPRAYDPVGDAYTWYESLRDETETRSLYAIGYYDINSSTELFFDLLATKNSSYNITSVDYNAIGGFGPPVDVLATNSFNPFGTDVTVGRVLTEAGQPRNEHEGHMYRFVIGIQGELANNMTWDVSYNEGQSYYNRGLDRLNTDAIPSSFLTVDGVGLMLDEAACAQYVTCTPINVFGENTITAAQIEFLKFKDQRIQEFKQRIIQANITGDLFAMPAGNAAFAAGLETHKESGKQSPGPREFNDPTDGSYQTDEAYVEFFLPLAADAAAAKSLNAELAARHVDNDLFGSDTLTKIGLDWAITDSWRVRTTHTTTFRAPNIENLFFGNDYGPIWPITLPFLYPLGTNVDPCDTVSGEAAGNAEVAQRCADDGVPANYVHASYLFQPRIVSNPLLKPEEGTMATFGIIFTPSSLDSFSLTLDYYELELEDGLGMTFADFSQVLRRCYVEGDPQNCRLVARRSNGEIETLDITAFNRSLLQVSGFDFAMNYAFDVGNAGSMNLNLQMHYQDQYDTRFSSDSDVEDVVGLEGQPELSGVFSLGWNSGNAWSGNYRIAFHDGARLAGEPEDLDPNNHANSYGNYMTHNVDASYVLEGNSGRRQVFTFGIRNLLDEESPYLSGFGYLPINSLGRSYFLQFSAEM